jgi:hypothetical protein
MTDVEAQARAMTKPERRAYLRAHGWTRLSRHGSETWLHPSHSGWRGPANGDRGFYTLAAAIRAALAEERYPLDRDVLDTRRG